MLTTLPPMWTLTCCSVLRRALEWPWKLCCGSMYRLTSTSWSRS